jgi:hypothetical protein
MLLLFCPIFILTIGSAHAQDTPATKSVTSTEGDSGEVFASSGSNRFVVWQDNNPGNKEIFLRRSTDNGATWKPIVNLSNNEGDSFLPLIAVSGTNVFVVWEQWSADNDSVDIILRRSTDNGATWKSSLNISKTASGSITPQIAVSGPNVYVVWVDYTNTIGGGDIFFKRSTDYGATWKTTVNLSNNKDDSILPRIAASGMNVYVTWEHDPQIDIFLKRSTDNGATWKSVKNLSNDGGKSTLSQIAISNANVYVIWVDYTDTIDTVGVGDIFFKRSTDNGATWKPTVNISNNPGESVLARVSASGDNVYVVWQQTSASLTSVDIILRRSTDNGATWKSPINVSNDPDGSLNPQIASTGTNVYVVWEKYSDSDILFKRSADGGATWKSVKNLSNSNQWTGNPDVAVSGSDVFVAWREGDPGLAGNIFVKWSTNDGSTWIYKKKLCDNNGNSDFAQIGL